MRSVRGLVIVIVVALAATACGGTPAPSKAAAGHRSPGPAPTAVPNNDSSAGCPITQGVSGTRPPAPFDPFTQPVPYVDTWYGNDAIWVRLPRGGAIPATASEAGGGLSVKFPWWRVLSGGLTAWAQPWTGGRRLAAQVGTVSEYGPIGFVPSELGFSGPGCWLITGSLDGRTLSFVARVVVTG